MLIVACNMNQLLANLRGLVSNLYTLMANLRSWISNLSGLMAILRMKVVKACFHRAWSVRWFPWYSGLFLIWSTGSKATLRAPLQHPCAQVVTETAQVGGSTVQVAYAGLPDRMNYAAEYMWECPSCFCGRLRRAPWRQSARTGRRSRGGLVGELHERALVGGVLPDLRLGLRGQVETVVLRFMVGSAMIFAPFELVVFR